MYEFAQMAIDSAPLPDPSRQGAAWQTAAWAVEGGDRFAPGDIRRKL